MTKIITLTAAVGLVRIEKITEVQGIPYKTENVFYRTDVFPPPHTPVRGPKRIILYYRLY